MNKKVEDEIKEVINPVKKDWSSKTEKELEDLLKKFCYICRSETSTFRNEVLSDNELAKVLIKIGEKYNNNTKILIDVVSSINNMFSRYKLKITEEIFQFLLEQTKNKKVNFYVSIFINDLPQFARYKHKWDYIMSIPAIAPKDKSINTFYRVINEEFADIPGNLKKDAAEIFRSYLEKNSLHETTRDKYIEIIKKLVK